MFSPGHRKLLFSFRYNFLDFVFGTHTLSLSLDSCNMLALRNYV